MTQPEPRAADRNTSVAMTILVVGISINALGVILVALRGIGWLGFSVMAVGLVLLLTAIVMLVSAARRAPAAEEESGGRGA